MNETVNSFFLFTESCKNKQTNKTQSDTTDVVNQDSLGSSGILCDVCILRNTWSALCSTYSIHTFLF